jgi:hypothetical protein
MVVLWTLVITLPVMGGACFVFLRWLRRRAERRTKELGGIWGGIATLDARHPQSIPDVVRALAGVGPLYGWRFSHAGDIRPVAGTLVITKEDLIWEPVRYLGRGRAQPFRLPRSAVATLSVEAEPPPALVGQRLNIRMVDGGCVSLSITDADGLRRALPSEIA